MAFDYATAFSRNIGWLTEEEPDRLRTERLLCGPALPPAQINHVE